MAKKDFYEVLGVERTASAEEIKSAYRKQAKILHPDVNPGDAKAEADFKALSEAYETLSDDQKRAGYDRFGHEAPNMGGGGGNGAGGFGGGGFGGFGFEDIIDSFFGGGQRRKNGPTRGNDLRYDLTIAFEEAVFGVVKEVAITKNENCTDCGGSGAKPGSQPIPCVVCGGTGQTTRTQNTNFGRFQTTDTCAHCRGEGKIIKDPCPKCQGKGKQRRSIRKNITIPAGIGDGQSLVLRSEGEPGIRGGDSGDLYIYVSVRPHKIFKRQETDLYCDVAITFAHAVLGGEINVPTLEGSSKQNVAEGTQPGTVLRIRGQGVPSLRNSGQRGDLYAKLTIEVPKKLNHAQKEALQQFDNVMHGREKSTNDATPEQTNKKKSGKKKESILHRVKDAFGTNEA